MNILDAFDDPKVFGPLIPKGSWEPWKVFLATLFALAMPMDDAGVIAAHCTGVGAWPVKPFGEAYLICGRRAGKSIILALIAVFLAVFRTYDEHLGPASAPPSCSLLRTGSRRECCSDIAAAS